MEFFKKEYPDTEAVTVDLAYVTFGDRLRAIRKERGMSQDEFAKLLGTSKQVLSRYEIGQRIPKITQVQEYAKKLNVSADYLMGDSTEEAAFNSLCPKGHPPFYKIFMDVMNQFPSPYNCPMRWGFRWRCGLVTGTISPRTLRRRPGRWPGPMTRLPQKRKPWCVWHWICRP